MPKSPLPLIRKSPESSLPIHPSMAVEALVGLERAQQLPRPPPTISTNPVLTSSDFLPKVPSLSVSRCQQPNRPPAALEPHNLTTMHPEPLAIHTLVQTPSRPQGFEIIPARSHHHHHHQQATAGHVIRLPQQPHPQVRFCRIFLHCALELRCTICTSSAPPNIFGILQLKG